MATAAQLAQRRRLVAAATKRHPPRAMPPAQIPRPTAYTRALTAVADELTREMHAALADEGLTAPRSDAADGDARLPVFNREGLLARLRRIAEAVVKRRGGFLDTAIQACAANVSSVSRAEWSKQAKAAVGIDLSQVEPNLTPTISAFRRANLDLITSMARDKVERVKAILEDAPNARVETIRDRILEEGNVTRRQAALIARDQVLSLNAQVTEKRHAAAGVEKYTWRTSGDGDVRPAHRALNGKVFAYADPPVVDAKKGRRENPGHDYQCRCTAEPVIEWGEEEAAAKRADAGDFKESEHPRDEDGEFTKEGGSRKGGQSSLPPGRSGGRRVPPSHWFSSGGDEPGDRDFGEPVQSTRLHIVQPENSGECGPSVGAIAAAHFGLKGDTLAALKSHPVFVPPHGVTFDAFPVALNQHMPVPGRTWTVGNYFPPGSQADPVDVEAGLARALHEGGEIAMLNVHVPATATRGGYWHIVALHGVEGRHAIIGDPEAPTVTRVPITSDGVGDLYWTGDTIIAKINRP